MNGYVKCMRIFFNVKNEKLNKGFLWLLWGRMEDQECVFLDKLRGCQSNIEVDDVDLERIFVKEVRRIG